MNAAFDLEKSVSLNGDSGPYLQYTYARTRSVLAKSQNCGLVEPGSFQPQLEPGSRKLEPEELLLLRTLYKFPEIVEAAAQNYAPNLICTFLFDLAQKFNLFYDKWPILNPEAGRSKQASSADVRNFRLALTAAVGQVIKNGLDLLGIKVVNKM